MPVVEPVPFNPVLKTEDKLRFDLFNSSKHPGSVCIANYKGGVGKTTITCLLGYYLAQQGSKVLLFDIDPQCSLSLALGFDPDEVNKTELTIYNLVKPSKWAKIKKTDFSSYVDRPKDRFAPKGLRLVKGSFDVDDLDMEIAKSLAGASARRVDELFLYCKQMMNSFEEFDYILVDCPPNKMFLTQAMLRACSFFLPVTIPDAISIYGMPRLLRWVKQIPIGERPQLLGYVLNAVNRTGGLVGGKVYSQQSAEARLKRTIQGDLEKTEKQVLGEDPALGVVPRLDAIAKFLGESDAKTSRFNFSFASSRQPTIDECLTGIIRKLASRMKEYRAKA
jgi:cellulose biosynthesis protein BcsQ